MGESTDHIHLTSAEIGNLWTQYMNDSMAVCVLKHFLKHLQDQDIYSIIEYALELAEGHLNKINQFLTKENFPVPIGFTDDDVNLDAPPLFSDQLVIHYMYIMAVHGIAGYAGSINTSIREDQVDYFIKCSNETMELYRRCTKTMVDKGLIDRPPNINAPDKPTFVTKQSYLTGWFGNRRPLNAIEVNGIFFNMKKDVIKIILEVAFRQVTTSKELRDYFKRGEQICNKQYDTFNYLLSESSLPSTSKLNDQILNSTEAPFSDKLMLYHVMNLISTAAGYYGAALALSQRRDLGARYFGMITEILRYAEDGMNIMIKNGWMEQPPMFDDRDKLAKKKK